MAAAAAPDSKAIQLRIFGNGHHQLSLERSMRVDPELICSRLLEATPGYWRHPATTQVKATLDFSRLLQATGGTTPQVKATLGYSRLLEATRGTRRPRSPRLLEATLGHSRLLVAPGNPDRQTQILQNKKEPL